MADEIKRLSEALKKADAQGNTEDARRIAAELRRRRGGARDALESFAQGTEQAEGQSVVGRAGEFVRDIPGAVASAARGPEGLPDLPEFDAPAPTTMQTLQAAGGLMAATTPKQQREIIEENYPGVQIEEIEADGKQYHIADWTDPEGNQHRGYINAPGLSGRDVTQFAGQMAAFTPAGRAGRGLGLMRRAATRVAPGTAATSAGLDVAAQGAGAEEGVSLERAGINALAGGGAEFLSPAASAMWRKLGGRSNYFNYRTGKLTGSGRSVAEDAGLSAEDITDLESHAQQTFAQFLESGIEPGTAMRAARVAEFDIPATRGQVGRAGQQMTAEERMRAGALGETSQSQLEQFGRQQRESIETAAEGVQERIGGAGARTEAEAGERALTGIRDAAENLRRQIDDAYGAVRGEEFAVSQEAAERLPQMVNDSLEEMADDLSSDLTPAAVKSMSIIGELGEAVARGDGAKFETFRRRLGNAIGAAKNATDKRAATRVKAAFDDWMDDSIDRGLFEGNPETLDLLKEARSLRTQYARRFSASDRTDRAGKVMQSIVEKAETPEEVVNYVFGQSQLGRRQATSSAMSRIKESMGEDSEAWDGIREAAWLRLTRNRRGEFVGGKSFKNNISELQSRNKDLFDTLYTKREQRLINRFSRAIEVTDPPKQNPSGTAASLENAIRYTLRRFGQRESFTKGNVGKGTILNFMARMRLPVLGRGLGGSPADRATDIRPPSAKTPAVPAGAAAGTNVSREDN